MLVNDIEGNLRYNGTHTIKMLNPEVAGTIMKQISEFMNKKNSKED